MIVDLKFKLEFGMEDMLFFAALIVSSFCSTKKNKTTTFSLDPTLFNRLESGVFNEIWKNYCFTDGVGKKHKIINLTFKNKYSAFLEKVGEEEETILEYHKNLLATGAISVGHIASMLLTPEKYDVKDVRIRLIIT